MTFETTAHVVGAADTTGLSPAVLSPRGCGRGRISTSIAHVVHVTRRHRRRFRMTLVVCSVRTLLLSPFILFVSLGPLSQITLTLGSYLSPRIVLSYPPLCMRLCCSRTTSPSICLLATVIRTPSPCHPHSPSASASNIHHHLPQEPDGLTMTVRPGQVRSVGHID